jgi:hypothetical protein
MWYFFREDITDCHRGKDIRDSFWITPKGEDEASTMILLFLVK